MAPHGLILSENEAIPSMMLFRLLLGLFEPILYKFLMQIMPQGSGPRKLAIFYILTPHSYPPFGGVYGIPYIPIKGPCLFCLKRCTLVQTPEA